MYVVLSCIMYVCMSCIHTMSCISMLCVHVYAHLCICAFVCVAVEVVGGSTRVGHSICIRALVHVGHTRSLSVHVAHYHMMCAYVTERGTIS